MSCVDLFDEKAINHILNGEVYLVPNRSTGAIEIKIGGGHSPNTGLSGKSEFPANWSDDDILNSVADVYTDPLSVRVTQPDGRIVVTGNRNGIAIRVIYDPRASRVVTGYPTNVPRNP